MLQPLANLYANYFFQRRSSCIMCFIIERCLCNTIIQTTWMTPAKSGPGFLMGQFWIISVYYTTRLLIIKCLNGIGSKAQHPGLPVPLQHPNYGATQPHFLLFSFFPNGFLHTWLHCDNGRVENGPSNLTENLVSGAFIWQIGAVGLNPLGLGAPRALISEPLCNAFITRQLYKQGIMSPPPLAAY